MNTDLKQIKVIISDLDGTLLNPQHKISEYTKSVFQELHNQGYLIIVATGRHHLDAMTIISKLNIPIYLVSSNGARIHSPEKEELFAFNIKSEIIKSALDLEIDPEITIVLYKENCWLTNRVNEKINSFQEEMKYHPKLVDYKKLEDFSTIKMFFAHENHQKLVNLKDAILTKGISNLHYAFSLPTCLEFMDTSVDKAVAIGKILKKEGLDFDQAISFGDGFNDVQMLVATKKGLIMGNAPIGLKEKFPELEVIATNAENGVAKYLSENLINKAEVTSN